MKKATVQLAFARYLNLSIQVLYTGETCHIITRDRRVTASSKKKFTQ